LDAGVRALGLSFILSIGACAAAADDTSASAGALAEPPTKAWTPDAVKDGNLRIASFNIRNFPRDTMSLSADAGAEPETAEPTAPRRDLATDVPMLLDLLERLDFDVLAVEEINDVRAFEAVLAQLGARNGNTYAAAFSVAWQHPQHLGIVVRGDRLRIEGVEEHPEIATRETLRAGLSARIVSQKEGGADFGVLVLHLASGEARGRATLRATQASRVAEVVARRQRELGDDDFIVLGDFNTAREDELTGFDEAIASGTNLARQANASSCSTYHVQSRANPVLAPSLIDHVYTAGLGERDRSVALVSGAHCAERSCQPFESASPASGTSYWGVSDHCPVYFEIADRDLD
jgi:endonuclease/exonuclease/phosphatase family metal-dependent hydrolase